MCQSHVSNRNLLIVVGLICLLSVTTYTIFTPLRFILATTVIAVALYWHLAINDSGTTPTSIPFHEHVPIIDTVLSQWETSIGSAYEAYHNHVYRIFHLIRAQLPECDTNDELYQQVAIAAVFHDLGIWSDKHPDGRLQADYLAPSATRAMEYLDANYKPESWKQPITLMITEHHKITPFESGSRPSVIEIFRRADTIDASFGLMRNGIRRSLHASLLQRWPRSGFLTKMLLPLIIQWEKDNPFTPPPIFKW